MTNFYASSLVVLRDYPRSANQFMFLTWHPFRVTSWTKLCSTEAIEKGLVENRNRVYGVEDEVEARALMKADAGVIEDLSQRLWLVVLSEKQENLLISETRIVRLLMANNIKAGN